MQPRSIRNINDSEPCRLTSGVRTSHNAIRRKSVHVMRSVVSITTVVWSNGLYRVLSKTSTVVQLPENGLGRAGSLPPPMSIVNWTLTILTTGHAVGRGQALQPRRYLCLRLRQYPRGNHDARRRRSRTARECPGPARYLQHFKSFVAAPPGRPLTSWRNHRERKLRCLRCIGTACCQPQITASEDRNPPSHVAVANNGFTYTSRG